jgi:hypothetical protein
MRCPVSLIVAKAVTTPATSSGSGGRASLQLPPACADPNVAAGAYGRLRFSDLNDREARSVPLHGSGSCNAKARVRFPAEKICRRRWPGREWAATSISSDLTAHRNGISSLKSAHLWAATIILSGRQSCGSLRGYVMCLAIDRLRTRTDTKFSVSNTLHNCLVQPQGLVSTPTRSGVAMPQVQQRVPVDRFSEEPLCASLQIVVFPMLARFACDNDDGRRCVRMNRPIEHLNVVNRPHSQIRDNAY